MADIDLTPTEEMASNAARGLELREKHGKGGTAVGVARARDIKNRKNLSPDTVRRMHSFFSRHAGNEAGGEDDAGYISFLLWGGAAGRSWAKRKSAQLDKDENAMSDTRKAIMERLGSAGKVKAGRAEQVMRDGTVHLDFRAAKEWLSGVTDSALRYIINDAQQAAKAMPDGNKWNYYHDLSLTAQDELQRRKRKASRPGAKAKMGMSPEERHAKEVQLRKQIELIRRKRAAARYPARKQELLERIQILNAQLSELTRTDDPRFNSRPGAKAKMGKAESKYLVVLESKATQKNVKFRTMAASESDARMQATAAYGDKWEVIAVVQEHSRPGAKAKMGKPQFRVRKLYGGYLAVDMNQGGGWERYDTTHEEVFDGLEDYERGYQKAYNQGLRWSGGAWRIPSTKASRPGAKAKFAEDETRFRKLRLISAYIANEANDITDKQIAEWKATVQDAMTSKDANVVRLAKRIKDAIGFSRPGAKAKMAVEAGWRVNPEARTTGMSVQELLPKLAKGHRFWANLKDGSTVSGTLKAFNANAVQIDKYGDVRSIQWTDIASIGAGNIGTGPYPIRASRPGAKAAFSVSDAEAYERGVKMSQMAALIPNFREGVQANPWFQLGYQMGVKHGPKAGGMMSQAKREFPAVAARLNASRPGAKVRNAADILKIEVMDGSTVTSSMTPSDFMAYAKRSLPGIGSTSFLPDMIARFNELAEEKGMRVRVRSNLAKSKNAIREGEKVSASDDAVSRKIRKLMDEGKPQKQAVAIALDLERRGDL